MAWTAPTTRSTGTLITAAIWNTDLTDNLAYLKSAVDTNTSGISTLNTDLDAVTQSADVSGSRAHNTVYQNTSAKIIIAIQQFGYVSAAGSINVFCGSANPPLTQVAQIGLTSTSTGNAATFVIPNNYYYYWVRVPSCDGVLSRSYEWTLH